MSMAGGIMNRPNITKVLLAVTSALLLVSCQATFPGGVTATGGTSQSNETITIRIAGTSSVASADANADSTVRGVPVNDQIGRDFRSAFADISADAPLAKQASDKVVIGDDGNVYTNVDNFLLDYKAKIEARSPESTESKILYTANGAADPQEYKGEDLPLQLNTAGEYTVTAKGTNGATCVVIIALPKEFIDTTDQAKEAKGASRAQCCPEGFTYNTARSLCVVTGCTDGSKVICKTADPIACVAASKCDSGYDPCIAACNKTYDSSADCPSLNTCLQACIDKYDPNKVCVQPTLCAVQSEGSK